MHFRKQTLGLTFLHFQTQEEGARWAWRTSLDIKNRFTVVNRVLDVMQKVNNSIGHVRLKPEKKVRLLT